MLLAQQNNQSLIEFTLAPLLEEKGIPLAIMGILVVFMALVLVATFISVLPHLIWSSTRTTKQAAQPATPQTTDSDSLPDEIVVVIAAAVADVMQKPHRIVQVRGLTPAEQGWSFRGRTQHHHSHQVHHRDRS